MPGILRFAAVLVLASSAALYGQEVIQVAKVDPAKVAQLKRLEPLSPEKVQIFVEAGQLDPRQADTIKRFIDANGVLNLPPELVGVEAAPQPQPAPQPPVAQPAPQPVQPPLAQPAPPVVAQQATPIGRRPDNSLDTLAWIRANDQNPLPGLEAAQAQQLTDLLKRLRVAGEGERGPILANVRPYAVAADAFIAREYTDAVDLRTAAWLWESVAGAHNPRAAGYIAGTHQLAMNTANPILVPYAKDAGGVRLHRKQSNEAPIESFYTSRELRDIIVDLEKSISECRGVRAASYLIEVYAARYHDGDAALRDTKRDRHRLVEACGGDKARFDEDEEKTWGSALPKWELALIAERLVPYLRSEDDDLRQIAENSLLICFAYGSKNDHKAIDLLKDAHKDWDKFMRWYTIRREQLLKGQ